MLFLDRRDHHEVRTHHVTEHRELAGLVRPRFDHRDISRIVDRQQGQRDADLIVEIPRGGVDRQTTPEHRPEQLLGAGLSIRASDGDERTSPREPAIAGERTQRRTGVLDGEDRDAEPHGPRRVRDHNRRRAGAHRLREMVVRVVMLPTQRHEAPPREILPRVGADAHQRAPVTRAGAERLGDARKGPEAHRARSAKISRTINSSSNGVFVVPYS